MHLDHELVWTGSRRQPIVQVAVAVKQVAAAGTYDVTWSATPNQGAITWLVALQ